MDHNYADSDVGGHLPSDRRHPAAWWESVGRRARGSRWRWWQTSVESGNLSCCCRLCCLRCRCLRCLRCYWWCHCWRRGCWTCRTSWSQACRSRIGRSSRTSFCRWVSCSCLCSWRPGASSEASPWRTSTRMCTSCGCWSRRCQVYSLSGTCILCSNNIEIFKTWYTAAVFSWTSTTFLVCAMIWTWYGLNLEFKWVYAHLWSLHAFNEFKSAVVEYKFTAME